MLACQALRVCADAGEARPRIRGRGDDPRTGATQSIADDVIQCKSTHRQRISERPQLGYSRQQSYDRSGSWADSGGFDPPSVELPSKSADSTADIQGNPYSTLNCRSELSRAATQSWPASTRFASRKQPLADSGSRPSAAVRCARNLSHVQTRVNASRIPGSRSRLPGPGTQRGV